MVNMQLSPAGEALIKGFEKFRPTAYKPTAKDVWTCGWGHTKGVTATTTCDYATAETWFKQDTADAVNNVNTHVTVPLTQNQFDALVSICFNVGDTAIDESTLMRKLNDSDYGGAANEFPKWRFQDHVPLKGLADRRAAEQAMFNKATPVSSTQDCG